MPTSFDIDLNKLTRHYHLLQKNSHPDRHTQSVETAQRLALQQAMMINEAYHTLRDPLQRAVYLLSLQGIRPDQADSIQDSAFLMEQMALREELVGIPRQADPAAASDHMQNTIQALMTTQLNDLADWFANPSQPSVVCVVVQKLQFLYKLQQEAATLATYLNEA